MPRQRSHSTTPTFSTDRTVLLSHKPCSLASSVDEAKAALSVLEICNDAAFQRRAKLDTVEEWTEFLASCTDSNNEINLESALKKCYALAYSMPPSPPSHNRSGIKDAPEPLSV
eukprot:185806_1